MASAKTAKLPWYKRWFSRPSPDVRVSVAAEIPARTPPMFYCDICGFAAKIRGVVYDHIKGSHKSVLDRHGRIREQPEGQQSSLQ